MLAQDLVEHDYERFGTLWEPTVSPEQPFYDVLGIAASKPTMPRAIVFALVLGAPGGRVRSRTTDRIRTVTIKTI
jgi:hypothetical protein